MGNGEWYYKYSKYPHTVIIPNSSFLIPNSRQFLISLDTIPHFKYLAHIREGQMLKKKIPLGESNFKAIIEENWYYVDKSLFIKDVEDGSRVLLFTRPRRFGKTLNLSMLRYFYDINGDNAKLFTNLAISSESEIMQKQGKHPVIYITLKDAKYKTLKECMQSIKGSIYEVIISYRRVVESNLMSEIDIRCLTNILSNLADDVDYAGALRRLSHALYIYYKAKPVILIDEYDTPIHEGYANNFYQEMISFMRVFLGSCLKDNDYLEKAVLTGILRVSRESMFSDLNNISVCSISEPRGSDKFGFVESEVADFLNYYDNTFSLEQIRFWYDGYNFCGAEIYNPWSILHCIESRKLTCHWVNTSGNDLVRSLCVKADESIKQELEIISQGGSIHKEIIDNIVFHDIEKNKDILWSFLVHSGYLRYDKKVEIGGVVDPDADLRTPNNELLFLFRDDIVKNWFTPPEATPELTNFMHNLISGEPEVWKQEFIQFCQGSLSYHDITGKQPEKIYHAFVLGMLTCLRKQYHIKSNREAGLGRSDVLLIPLEVSKSPRGVIFEFKKVDTAHGETFERALVSAKTQILNQKYAQELQTQGVQEIVSIAVAFLGKEVMVEVF